MISFSQEEHDALVLRAAETLSFFQPGEDAIAVLSRIYCQNLPDKSPRQGEMMARELTGWISRFQASFHAVQENPAGFARYTLDAELRDLPLDDQCRLLHRMLREAQGLTPGAYSGAFTPEARDAMLEETVRILTAHTELPSVSADDYERRQQVKQHCDGDMILAATAMILYTMAKNGELSGLPRDLTLAQAALTVCTNDAQCQLIWAQSSGYISASRTELLLQHLATTFKILWFAIAIPLTASAFFVEGAFALTITGAVTLATVALATPAVFRIIDDMLAEHGEMVSGVPLVLEEFRATPLEYTAPARTAGNSAPSQEDPAVGPEEDEDDDPDFQLF